MITHVALRVPGGRVYALPCKARHADVIAYMATMVEPDAIHTAEQGFKTDAGRFLSRREAWNLAEETGQLKSRTVVVAGIPRLHMPRGPELFSEDLW